MNPTPKLNGRSRLVLSLAFGLIATLMMVAHLFALSHSRAVQIAARSIAENSMASIGLVQRMGRDIERQRLPVDRHIFERDGLDMAATEKQIAERRADFAAAAREFEPLATDPGERSAWQRLKEDVTAIEGSTDAALALSRQNLDAEARAAMERLDAKFAGVERDVESLVEINQVEVRDGVSRIRELQLGSINFRWALAILAVTLTLVMPSPDGWRTIFAAL